MRMTTDLLVSGVLVAGTALSGCQCIARLTKAAPAPLPATQSPATPILQS
jgi:hypothetical protein